jgi:hypothetical protein
LRFFVEEKLPEISMSNIKESGWMFVVKAIEALDAQLGLEYTSVPMPLLWKIIREAPQCHNAITFTTKRLLKVLLLLQD